MFLGTGVTSSVTHAAGGLGRRCQRTAEGTGRAGEDKCAYASRHGLFQEIERARDIGVNKALPTVSDDVGLVQGCRMDDSIYAGHASPDMIPVCDGPDLACEV
jgi:hypothetical protein